MAGRVGEAGPGIVEAVRAGRVEAPKIAVNPGGGGGGREPEAEDGEEAGDSDEDEEADGDPYGAGDDDERREEDEGEDGGSEGEAGEEEEDATRDHEGGEAHELRGVGGVLPQLLEDRGRRGGPRRRVVRAIGHCSEADEFN